VEHIQRIPIEVIRSKVAVLFFRSASAPETTAIHIQNERGATKVLKIIVSTVLSSYTQIIVNMEKRQRLGYDAAFYHLATLTRIFHELLS
jgi:hypothetical protein